MKRISWIPAIVLLLGATAPLSAGMCYMDNTLGATLLLPYFEVDLEAEESEGVTTLFSINNGTEEAALAHVIMWTNWAAPTISFDVFLTGYDVVSINLRHVFAGNLPITADEASDPSDTISPHGIPPHLYTDNPHWDGSFESCTEFFPFFVNPLVTGASLDRLVNGHTGQPVASLGDNYLGTPCSKPGFACGYITVDSVSKCSLIIDPGDPEYFVDGGGGIANNRNTLWGDYYIVDPANDFAFGDVLVHVEASDSFNADLGEVGSIPPNPNHLTFYGRFTRERNGADNREPLGSTWAVRYLSGGAADHTDLLVWRDPMEGDILPAGVDAEGPDWYPLNEGEIIAFNESEDALQIGNYSGMIPVPCEDPTPFVAAAGRYSIGGAYAFGVPESDLNIPFDWGWLYLNLNIAPQNHCDFRPFALAQSHVTAVLSALGSYTVGLPAVVLEHACNDPNELVNLLPNVIPYY